LHGVLHREVSGDARRRELAGTAGSAGCPRLRQDCRLNDSLLNQRARRFSCVTFHARVIHHNSPQRHSAALPQPKRTGAIANLECGSRSYRFRMPLAALEHTKAAAAAAALQNVATFAGRWRIFALREEFASAGARRNRTRGSRCRRQKIASTRLQPGGHSIGRSSPRSGR